MNRGLEVAVQLDLALHLGLVATVFSILIWRLAQAGESIRRWRHLRRVQDAGFNLTYTWAAVLLAASELIFKVAGLLGSFVVFGKAFRFFQLADALVGLDSGVLDAGVFRGVWRSAENLTVEMLAWSLIVVIFLFLDYTSSVSGTYLVSGKIGLGAPARSHPHSIPREWETAPEAMWEERIEEAASVNEQGSQKRELMQAVEENRWREDWSVWAKCVVAYRELGRGAD